MTDRKTLFVVGAGAGVEVGMPTGDQLMTNIRQWLVANAGMRGIEIDETLFVAMQIVQKGSGGELDIGDYIKSARRMRTALVLAPSIDNYVHTHSGDSSVEMCAKLAIVREILAAEERSLMPAAMHGDWSEQALGSIESTWYVKFFKLLSTECSNIEELEQRLSDITMIIFNYDRCIEHFLLNAIQILFHAKFDEAVRLVKCVKWLHPYGVVGDLSWQNVGKAIDYGKPNPLPQDIVDGALKIRTFTEGTTVETSEIDEVRRSVLTAKKIVFLGFAFHPLNMRLLAPWAIGKNPPSAPQKRDEIAYCYGTTLNISDSNQQDIRECIARMRNVHGNYGGWLNSMACAQLLNEYERSLAFD